MKRSYLEESFERAILVHGLPNPVREFRFHRWRFDFAWPKLKVAVEIDGGTYMTGGHHSGGKGYENDCRKSNQAQLEGWAVMRADRNMVIEWEFGDMIKKILLRKIREKAS